MRAVDRGRSKSVKAVRAYVCFLERKVYAFLSTFDKRGERVCGECCGPAFFVYRESRGSRRANDDGPAASDAREVVNESNTRKEEVVFSFLGEVLFSLL